MGVSGFQRYKQEVSKSIFSSLEAHFDKESPKEEKKEKAEDPSECVVCLDAKRTVVNVPCGHILCWYSPY